MEKNGITHEVKFRWLGTAGMEFTDGDKTILVDPFFTRPPITKNFFMRVRSNQQLVQKWITTCDAIFVTHAHYDHVMDVPAVNRLTHAPVYGSNNVNRIIRICGVPDLENLKISIGDEIMIGDFVISVLQGTHGRTPIDFLLNRPLPIKMRFPPRLTDYRLDGCFAFRIQWKNMTFLIGESPIPADLAFFYPLQGPRHYVWYLPTVAPQVIIPIHWDDFFLPLDHSIRSLPPQERGFPPALKRINIQNFCRDLEAEIGDIKMIIPERFTWMTASQDGGKLSLTKKHP